MIWDYLCTPLLFINKLFKRNKKRLFFFSLYALLSFVYLFLSCILKGFIFPRITSPSPGGV